MFILFDPCDPMGGLGVLGSPMLLFVVTFGEVVVNMVLSSKGEMERCGSLPCFRLWLPHLDVDSHVIASITPS